MNRKIFGHLFYFPPLLILASASLRSFLSLSFYSLKNRPPFSAAIILFIPLRFYFNFRQKQTKEWKINAENKNKWRRNGGGIIAAAKTDLAEGARKKKKQNGKRNNSRRNWNATSAPLRPGRFALKILRDRRRLFLALGKNGAEYFILFFIIFIAPQNKETPKQNNGNKWGA